MNGITHFATGLLCQVVVFTAVYRGVARVRSRADGVRLGEKYPRVLLVIAYAGTAVLAFFSHGFMDSLARYTYHDSSADKWANPFYGPWTYTMLASAVLLGAVAIARDWRYAWGMAFGLFYDLMDYNTFRVIEEVVLQGLVDAGTISLATTDVFPFRFHDIGQWTGIFDWIDTRLFGGPVNLTENPAGSLFELVVLAGLLVGWYLGARADPLPPPKHPQRRGTKIAVYLVFALWISDDIWVGLLGFVPGGLGPVIVVGITFGTILALLVFLGVISRRRDPVVHKGLN